jgi:site-specific DNA-methyltransferase (adenine-specific)
VPRRQAACALSRSLPCFPPIRFFRAIAPAFCARCPLPAASVDLVVTDPPYGVRYRDRLNRTIANDDNPERILGAFNDVYRVLKPDTFCVSFYGWNRADAFLTAWRRAGFVPVGHLVWQKNYASSRGFLEARHEQAYLLAKGRPAKPARPLSDVRPWQYSGNSIHPTEKAVSILRPLIESFSKPGGVVTTFLRVPAALALPPLNAGVVISASSWRHGTANSRGSGSAGSRHRPRRQRLVILLGRSTDSPLGRRPADIRCRGRCLCRRCAGR